MWCWRSRGQELFYTLDYLSRELDTCRIIGVIDTDERIKNIGNMQVLPPYSISTLAPDSLFIITSGNNQLRQFYLDSLVGKNFVLYNEIYDLQNILNIDRTTVNRARCASFHIDGMNWYFDTAESEEQLNIFWSEKSIFKQLFKELDLSNVIEIACGRGRHVPKYIEAAEHITLVDILQKNIDICKKRFGENKKISFYKNNGYNIELLKDGEYSAIFSYDSMVHFELLDINSYLNEFYRVLKCGGRALIHHSNLDAMYNGSFSHSIQHGRAFMNYKIFSYLAINAGFNVLEQRLINWNNQPDIDCLTLLEKPKK